MAYYTTVSLGAGKTSNAIEKVLDANFKLDYKLDERGNISFFLKSASPIVSKLSSICSSESPRKFLEVSFPLKGNERFFTSALEERYKSEGYVLDFTLKRLNDSSEGVSISSSENGGYQFDGSLWSMAFFSILGFYVLGFGLKLVLEFLKKSVYSI